MLPLLLALLSGAPIPTWAIAGVVRDRQTHEPVPNALVVLQCGCLDGSRETATDRRGQYVFSRLPAGVYTVRVLAGHDDVSKLVRLPAPAPTPRQRSAR